MRVNPQVDLGADLAQTVERRERHEDVVANPTDVDHNPIGMLLENAAFQVRDHDRAGRYVRQVVARLRGGLPNPTIRVGTCEWA